MSRCDRIARRRAWRAECPHEMGAQTSRAVSAAAGRPWPERTTYHIWTIAKGLRHRLFQLMLRARRERLGLEPTSTDMHRTHGVVA